MRLRLIPGRDFCAGYLSLYDRVKRQAYQGDYQLDYPPLRLLVMSVWAKQVHRDFPGAEDGKPEYVEPLLRLNLFCELTTAVGIFFLVRLWLQRARGATHSRFLRKFSVRERDWICAPGSGERGVVGAFADSRRACLAAMGRLAFALLCLGCVRRFD